MRAVELQLLPEGGSFPGIDTTFAHLGAVSRDAVINLGYHSDGSYTCCADSLPPVREAIEPNDDIQ